MDIFDAHAHLGESQTSGNRTIEDELVSSFEKSGVGGALILPYPINPDATAAHDLVADFCTRRGPTFVGGACLNPSLPEDEFVSEIERCVQDLEFRAIKFHPMSFSMSPLYARCRIVFEMADELRVPVIIHTGRGVPFALPSLAIPRAQEFPDLPIILGHAGYQMYSDEALIAAQVCPNIYLETSWCAAEQIRKFIRTLGPERVMMGSDSLLNLPVELAKYHAIGLSKPELEQCLTGTACRLFRVRVS
jgi:predicted TIM-barrel fold metal-dependent hydrolase